MQRWGLKKLGFGKMVKREGEEEEAEAITVGIKAKEDE